MLLDSIARKMASILPFQPDIRGSWEFGMGMGAIDLGQRFPVRIQQAAEKMPGYCRLWRRNSARAQRAAEKGRIPWQRGPRGI
jgi:hypothetical protein